MQPRVPEIFALSTQPQLETSKIRSTQKTRHFLLNKTDEGKTLFDQMIEDGDPSIITILLDPIKNQSSHRYAPQSEATKKFLDLMSHFLSNGVKPNNALKLLFTAAHIIAKNSDSVSIQQNLLLISRCLELGADKKEILEGLQFEDNKSNTSLGYKILCVEDVNATQNYLSFLYECIDSGIDVKDIFSLFKIETDTHLTTAHMIARHQDVTSTLHFLTFLSNSLERGVDAKSMLALLNMNSLSGWKLIHIIAGYQDEKVMQAYLELQTKCIRKGCATTDAYNLLFSIIPKNDILLSKQNILSKAVHKAIPKTLYLLIKTGLLRDADYQVLAKYKEIVLGYILMLPRMERYQDLKSARNPEYSLGKLFKLKSSLPDDPNIFLKIIDEEIVKIKYTNTSKRESTLTITTTLTQPMTIDTLVPIYIPVHQKKHQVTRESAIKRVLNPRHQLDQFETSSSTHLLTSSRDTLHGKKTVTDQQKNTGKKEIVRLSSR